MKIKFLYNTCLALIILSLAQSCSNPNNNNTTYTSTSANDSIAFWIESAKNKSFNIEKRKQLLSKSYQKIKQSTIDTSFLKHLSAIAYQNFKLGDTLLFKTQNEEILELATKIKDSFTIGDVHWNYASFYNKKEVYDSAYFHFNSAYKFFNDNGNVYEAAKTQYGMAFVRGRFRDFTGSEDLTIKAITKFKTLNDYESLYSCYNHLAQLQNDIYEFDRALFYYKKAIEYGNKIDNNYSFYASNLNNIGNTYLKKGDYEEALAYFDEKLKLDSIKQLNSNSYAITLDNKAYCKLLMSDTLGVKGFLKKSLQIRDSLKNKSGLVISKIHLSKYYEFVKDTSQAIIFAQNAYKLSKEIKNSRDYIASLELLEKLDTKNTEKYLKQHIRFTDSLQIAERKIQNKFTRIDFETDEYIEENERLSQQKIWIIVTGFSLLSILGLLLFLKDQASKNEKLRLENEQQKANEQVYLLTLKQQEKLEKEKIKERNRISEELHDGILGKLFGTRVGLGFLNISGDNDTIKQHHAFLNELQIIEKEIREVSHKLNDNLDSTQLHFTTIIQQMLDKKSKIGGFEYELHLDEHIDWSIVNEVIRVNLYRILQEAIQNIIKHASAKYVIVAFKFEKKDLIMLIQDDGIGFNCKRKSKGIGMKNMKSRAEKINGELHIETTSDKGTKIEVQITLI
ncbi:ATP-binding protein [Psychroserpens luteus]|uniref:histidine kinase n=1 Tax=Psychroserpens luteus TaxID=1434066 RepID=A0ABW5ZP66_9FLAO|nr:tetratricopeptide repeat-containing sensor histidine kinase [Psychroserpens luteus]